VDTPLTETATFYPGLTINTSGKGSVAYSYGSVSASIESVSQQTIFVAPGTQIQLAARPKLFIFLFSGWSGASTSSQSSIPITLNSPQSITANFSYNYFSIGIVALVVIVIIAGLIFFLLRRRRPKTAPSV
jgi:hypothetical protein